MRPGVVKGLELLPCPLCGAEAELVNAVADAHVRCGNPTCGCAIKVGHENADDMVALRAGAAKWNRRRLSLMAPALEVLG